MIHKPVESEIEDQIFLYGAAVITRPAYERWRDECCETCNHFSISPYDKTTPDDEGYCERVVKSNVRKTRKDTCEWWDEFWWY